MEDCVFCNIISGVVPASKEFENDTILGFRDIKPEADVHLVFIPKKHISSLSLVQTEDQQLLGELLLAMRDTAAKLNIENYKIVNNNGHYQVVPHIHFHLLGDSKKGGI